MVGRGLWLKCEKREEAADTILTHGAVMHKFTTSNLALKWGIFGFDLPPIISAVELLFEWWKIRFFFKIYIELFLIKKEKRGGGFKSPPPGQMKGYIPRVSLDVRLWVKFTLFLATYWLLNIAVLHQNSRAIDMPWKSTVVLVANRNWSTLMFSVRGS